MRMGRITIVESLPPSLPRYRANLINVACLPIGARSLLCPTAIERRTDHTKWTFSGKLSPLNSTAKGAFIAPESLPNRPEGRILVGILVSGHRERSAEILCMYYLHLRDTTLFCSNRSKTAFPDIAQADSH